MIRFVRTPVIFRWTLLLALLFTQGLAVAHAFDHDLLDDRSHCTTCVHGQGLDSVLLATEPAPLAPAHTEAPAADTSTPVYSRPLRLSHIRGPPLSI